MISRLRRRVYDLSRAVRRLGDTVGAHDTSRARAGLRYTFLYPIWVLHYIHLPISYLSRAYSLNYSPL